MKHETYKYLGHKSKAKPPTDFRKIRVHFVFDVKYDGSHKSRVVSDGHLTDVPLSRICSGVVSLKYVRLVLFLE